MQTILIAEDDRFLASAYRVKFESENYKVEIVNDGQAVLDYLEKQKPTLIMLDLMMPNVDGFTVLEKIKATPELHNTPIIVTSNLSQAKDIQKAKALGAKDYIVKSQISIQDLVNKIKSYL